MPYNHMICSVLGCKKDPEASLFRPPGPRKSWDLYCAWIKATGNPKFLNLSTVRPEKISICEKHFKDEEVSLMKSRRKTCVPTLQLPEPLQIQDSIDIEASANNAKQITKSVAAIDPESVENPPTEPVIDETSQIRTCLYNIGTALLSGKADKSYSALKEKLPTPVAEKTLFDFTILIPNHVEGDITIFIPSQMQPC